MQKDYIQKRIISYNEQLMESNLHDLTLGLFHGKMGLSIYFYMQYQFFNDKRYEKIADRLLEEVYDKIGKRKDTGIENGITGIGVGFLFLLKNKLCEGNPNNVLKEIDDVVFKALCNSVDGQSDSIYEDICKCLYLCERMKNSGLAKMNRMLFSEILIQAFNKICNNMSYILNTEPLSFSPTGYSLLLFLRLVELMERQHVYDYKIRRTLKEWGEKIKAVHPISIGHRYLLDKMIMQIPHELIANTEKHHEISIIDTQIEDFFSSEMRNMELSFSFGASGLWLFMLISEMSDKQVESLLFEKILTSCIWKKKDKEESEIITDSLFSGLPGIILTYQILLKKHA